VYGRVISCLAAILPHNIGYNSFIRNHNDCRFLPIRMTVTYISPVRAFIP